MSRPLFDEIHNDAYLCDRTSPATIEEFINFGLTAEDYSNYVGFQMMLQGELMLYGHPKEVTYNTKEKLPKTYRPTFDALIAFCAKKNLISHEMNRDGYLYTSFDKDNAMYYHGWFRYPRDPSEFRLIVERKLSQWWDEEDAYILETLDVCSFSYDDCVEYAENCMHILPNSPVRMRRYDPEKKEIITLDRDEVLKAFDIMKREKANIEKELAQHDKRFPSEQSADAATFALPRVKKRFELCDRQEIIDNVYDLVERAMDTCNVYKFKNTDTLMVICGENACKENEHLLSEMKVEFSFYGKGPKQYTVTRCSHCRQFQIALHDLIEIFDSYGVPQADYLYDTELSGDFSDFSETSKFFDMGYTVSQSVGLRAERRQAILKKAIDDGKATKQETLSYLRQRMSINGMKTGNEIAYGKWKEDYEYISKL